MAQDYGELPVHAARAVGAVVVVRHPPHVAVAPTRKGLIAGPRELLAVGAEHGRRQGHPLAHFGHHGFDQRVAHFTPQERCRPARIAALMTPRTRLVSLTTPHNPTGTTLDEATLRAVIGDIIQAFGELMMHGNFIIGLIVFSILVIVNFVVITRGSTRIAEVAARFTLDAMPGKQMAIDADLNAGLIGEADARRRRSEVAKEAEFYGAMDGASKFVRGDAIAGLIITALNLVGGIAIGDLTGDGLPDLVIGGVGGIVGEVLRLTGIGLQIEELRRHADVDRHRARKTVEPAQLLVVGADGPQMGWFLSTLPKDDVLERIDAYAG